LDTAAYKQLKAPFLIFYDIYEFYNNYKQYFKTCSKNDTSFQSISCANIFNVFLKSNSFYYYMLFNAILLKISTISLIAYYLIESITLQHFSISIELLFSAVSTISD
jgi:hypothetical protein